MHTHLTLTRLKGIDSALFPTCRFSLQEGKSIVFRLAMGRELFINLVSFAWSEISPDGEFSGELNEAGRKRLLARIARG